MKDNGGYVRDAKELQVMQSYPLWMKVMLTKQRIREWVYQFGEDSVVVSFSGGKDSTVLLHLVREEFPNVRAVFSNTGLEYPEIQRFVKSFDNVDIVTPKMRFNEVISTYGYPLIGKEVAEAIYYARRIRSQSSNVERERERERAAQASQSTSAQSFAERGRQDTPCKTVPYGEVNWKRLEIGGGERSPHPDKYGEKQKNIAPRKMGLQSEWKRLEIGGAEPQENGDQRFAHDRRELQQTATSRDSTDWSNWRRGCL